MKAIIQIFALLIISYTASAEAPDFENRISKGQVDQNILDEVSGMAASSTNSDIIWVHNDDGEIKKVYAINTSARLVATYKLEVNGSRDWEDIAVGPGPIDGVQYIYVGDIGDNSARYNERSIYRFPEPTVDADQEFKEFNIAKEDIDIITYQYPDGKRDAETLMLDPLTKDLYVVSKREANVSVYLLSYPQSTSEIIVAEKTTTLPYGAEGFDGSGVVAADISKNGREIIIKQYFQAYYYFRAPGQTVPYAMSLKAEPLKYQIEPQGEAMCWDRDGTGYYTLSEEGPFKTQPTLYYYKRIGSDVKKKAQNAK